MNRTLVKRWCFVLLFLVGAALAVTRPVMDGLVLLGFLLMLPFVVSFWSWEVSRAVQDSSSDAGGHAVVDGD